MSLRHRDTALRELMDDPACDPERLAATLRRFGTVNRLVSGWDRLYRSHVRPALLARARHGSAARVLDIGCGGGDVASRLAALARRDGLPARWLGIDPDPRALEVAVEREREDVRFRRADSTEVRESGESFDVVLSNHVLHHLDASALAQFADDSLALSRGPVLHADIRRGRLAYALYAVGITPIAPGTFLRTDGLRSVRRSYRPDELESALGAAWRVEAPAPFRVLAVGAGRA
ncbi:methyltransferase domain-containing protein [Microbacterium sp.]|uniref:methyltransferase domain-containing protein n=1 Tax=Microbacterium sp. TaxID=51671 RepID=UPI0039E55AF9